MKRLLISLTILLTTLVCKANTNETINKDNIKENVGLFVVGMAVGGCLTAWFCLSQMKKESNK